MRRRSLALLPALVTTFVLIAPTAAHAALVAPRVYGPAIEGYAAYSPQSICSPTAKPGVVAWRDQLLRTYTWTRSLGIVRACDVGGRSEHKEGRALDWGVSVYSTRDVAAVNAVMAWLFATDKYGNRHAMARRLGIQYIIWNHRIWGSYAASQGWRTYTGASPHTDHVHFSFSWPGANRTTSYWTGGTPNTAVTSGGTTGGSDGTAISPNDDLVSEPQPPATLLQAASYLSAERLYLDARRVGGVTTTSSLKQGQPYLVEVAGTYQYKAGASADAECSNSAAAPRTWIRSRSLDPRTPDADNLDVYLNGIDGRFAGDSAECDPHHTYRWTYVPERTGRANFRVWDTRFGDNAGGLSVRVSRLSTDDADTTFLVRGASATGATGPARYRRGVEYVVAVTGTWMYSTTGRADAECLVTGGQWVRRLADGSDFAGLQLNGDDVAGDPLVDTGGRCDTLTHDYRFRWTPREDVALSARVSDAMYSDNTGTLTVRVVRADLASRLPEPPPESLTVDSRRTDVTTARSYRAGVTYEVTVGGTYAAGAGVTADAECTATTTDAVWRATRDSALSRRLLWDLMLNDRTRDWDPVDGDGACSPGHAYRLLYTPGADGPLHFHVRDVTYADNSGSLSVSVRRA